MQALSRRSAVKSLASVAIGAPFVWIPRIAIADDRRGGLVESVQVYSNLTQLSTLNRYAPDLDPSERTSRIQNTAIINSASKLQTRRYVKVREQGCELRTDPRAGRVTYPAFRAGYQDMCLPFFHVNYAVDREIITLQGPHLVCLSVTAEKIYQQQRSKDLCRDLLYPNAQSHAASLGFEEGCNEKDNVDRILCPASIVVIEYVCQSNLTTGAATTTVYDLQTTKIVYKTVVQYNI